MLVKCSFINSSDYDDSMIISVKKKCMLLSKFLISVMLVKIKVVLLDYNAGKKYQ